MSLLNSELNQYIDGLSLNDALFSLVNANVNAKSLVRSTFANLPFFVGPQRMTLIGMSARIPRRRALSTLIDTARADTTMTEVRKAMQLPFQETVKTLASLPFKRITISDLSRLGLSRDEDAIITSARYVALPAFLVVSYVLFCSFVQSELPIRLARRIDDIQRLPFIVGCNPHIRSVYDLYCSSLKLLLAEPPIESMAGTLLFSMLYICADQAVRCSRGEVHRGPAEAGRGAHGRDPDPLARHHGVQELHGRGRNPVVRLVTFCFFYSLCFTFSFLDKKIRARIGIRLLAESHLSLHQPPSPDYMGIVNRRTSPSDIIRASSGFAQELCGVTYGVYPEVKLDGHVDATFAYIPVHLEYVIFELLKNAMRASIEVSGRGALLFILFYVCSPDDSAGSITTSGQSSSSLPPVEVTICKGPTGMSLRFRDRGGGVPPKNLSAVWLYSFSSLSPDDQTGDSIFGTQVLMSMQAGMGGPLAGLGFGLPMSRQYAEYFGGSLELVSLYGHGCDVFVNFRDLADDRLDNAEAEASN